MLDGAITADHENGALGNVLQSDHVRVDDAVRPNHVFVVVGEQREVQLLRVTPRLQREEGVGADAEHLRIRLVQLRDRVTAGAHALLAYAAERRWEKSEHDGTVPQLLAERHVLPVLIRQCEIGRLRAHVYGHRNLLPSGVYSPADRAGGTTWRRSCSQWNGSLPSFPVCRNGLDAVPREDPVCDPTIRSEE